MPPSFTWWEGGREALLDQIICECGWESATFFDGEAFAYEQWKSHVAQTHHCKVVKLKSTQSSKEN